MTAPAALTSLQLTALQNEIGNFYTNSVQRTLSDPALTAMDSAINIFINSPSLVRNTVIAELNSLSATISSYNTGSSAVFEELSSLVIAENALIQINGFYGQAGSHGPSGPVGLKGIQGSQGPVGDKGDQGLQGPQGDQGPQGIQGSPGIPGNPGAFSAQVQGFADNAATSATAAANSATASANSAAAAAASASSLNGTVIINSLISINNIIGNTPIIAKKSPSTMLADIKSAVAALTGSFTTRDIATAIATAVGFSDNTTLINNLTADFNINYSNDASSLQSNMGAVSPLTVSDSPKVIDGIVQSPDPMPGQSTLSTGITDDSNNNSVDYPTIVTNIQNSVAALTGSFTVNDIVTAIANAIRSSNNINLINDLELEFSSYLLVSNVPVSNIKAHIVNNISGSDGDSIAQSIYNFLNGHNIEGAIIAQIIYNSFYGDDLSNAAGARGLSDAITANEVLSLSDAIGNIAINTPVLGGSAPTSISDAINKIETAIGNTSIIGGKYPFILANIKSAVAALSGSFSKNDIAVAIASTIGSASGSDLTGSIWSNNTGFSSSQLQSSLEIDFDYSSSLSAAQIQALIANLTGTDGPSIAVSLYHSLHSASSNQGLNLLSSDIASDHTNHAIDYATILNSIKSAVAALTGSFSKNDIAAAIATAIGASSDNNLINSLEIDFDTAAWLSASQIQANIANVSGTDGPSIATSLYYNLTAGSIYQGLILLSSDITSDHSNNSANYADILRVIKSAVIALTGSFSKNDIAVAIATAIRASSDSNLINSLEIDFNISRSSASQIQAGIANLDGTDGPSIAVSLYSILTLRSASAQGADLLSINITSDHINNSVNYANILSAIKSAVAALTGSFSKNDIAVAIATAIGASNDSNLINDLEIDFDASAWLSAAQIQASIASLSGTDGPSIVTSLYSNISQHSSAQGLIMLSRNIENSNNNLSLATAIGGSFINTPILGGIASSTLSDAVNKLENAIGSDTLNSAGLLGNSTIAPASLAIAVNNINTVIGDSSIIGKQYPLMLLANIKSTVAALTGSFSTNDIAVAIATAIGASSDRELISSLESVFNSSNWFSASQLQSYIATISGTDATSIALSLYYQLASAEGLDLLTNDIENATNFSLSSVIGNTAIDTPVLGGSAPTSISDAISIIEMAIGDNSIQVGTLRSLYSCASPSDSNPTLIATGSDTLAGTLLAMKQCSNWAFITEFATLGASNNNIIDAKTPNVYISTNSSGPCFDAIGSMWTLPAQTMFTQPFIINTPAIVATATIPATRVTCANNNCATAEIYVQSVSGIVFDISPLTVTCTETSCTTSATTASTGPYNLTVPSLTVGAVGATSGSLYNLCMYELDH